MTRSRGMECREVDWGEMARVEAEKCCDMAWFDVKPSCDMGRIELLRGGLGWGEAEILFVPLCGEAELCFELK